MLALAGNPRIFLFNGYIDMRNGFEGLCAAIENHFSEVATSGAYFAFLNRSRDRIKVLYWDNDGFVIWYKRLEKGRFSASNKGHIQMERREFLMLLEGIVPKRLYKRHKIL